MNVFVPQHIAAGFADTVTTGSETSFVIQSMDPDPKPLISGSIFVDLAKISPEGSSTQE